MSELVIDDQLADRLGGEVGPIEFRTRDGRRLGTFKPEPARRAARGGSRLDRGQ